MEQRTRIGHHKRFLTPLIGFIGTDQLNSEGRVCIGKFKDEKDLITKIIGFLDEMSK